MNTPKLIGLIGRAGVGKDTVRQMLVDEYGFDGIAFADPIRAMLGALLDMVHQHHGHMTQRELKEQPIPTLDVSYRELAQKLGTEWGRNLVDPALWVRVLAARVAAMRSMGAHHIVVSDVRAANEALWIVQNGGELWHIVRPSADPVREHSSEADVDFVALLRTRSIDNSGTLDALWLAVSDAMGDTPMSPFAQARELVFADAVKGVGA